MHGVISRCLTKLHAGHQPDKRSKLELFHFRANNEVEIRPAYQEVASLLPTIPQSAQKSQISGQIGHYCLDRPAHISLYRTGYKSFNGRYLHA